MGPSGFEPESSGPEPPRIDQATPRTRATRGRWGVGISVARDVGFRRPNIRSFARPVGVFCRVSQIPAALSQESYSSSGYSATNFHNRTIQSIWRWHSSRWSRGLGKRRNPTSSNSMPRRSSGPRRIPRFRWTWTRPGTPPKKAKAETDESSSRSTGRRGRGGTTWRERRRDCGDGFGPVRQPPIASSTRLYRPQLLARSMEFPLREKIAGEIALSDQPGKTMRKWREELRISQTVLATHMRVSPSVISDYEAGRRTSPGIKTIHRLVDALLEIDQRTGQKLSKRFQEYSDVIPSMRDWAVGVRAADFLRKIDGKLLTQKLNTRRLLNGYTVIDSMKAITTLDASDYLRIYGSTSERALFFTGVKYGRSPMIAIKAHPMKPAMVVYVQPENIDDLAVKLAELDNIILARTDLDQGELISRLERIA